MKLRLTGWQAVAAYTATLLFLAVVAWRNVGAALTLVALTMLYLSC